VNRRGRASRRVGLTLAALLVPALATVCAAPLAAAPGTVEAAAQTVPTTSPTVPIPTWVDVPVSFTAGGVTVHGTFRHPVGVPGKVPAALLIAGSGPTDRNGNSALLAGTVGTLETVADWLSADGVASLRYDKLGSGQTGLGPYALDAQTIGVAPFEQEAAAALRFLAAQRAVDPHRLAVIGHSEGALFALLLATGQAGRVPAVHALGLLEPLSERYLTVISAQVVAQVQAQTVTGQITPAVAAQVEHTLAVAVSRLRSTGRVAAGLPYGLANVLDPSTALFLSQADRHDPAAVAARLPTRTPVLVSCSDADTQVSCAEVSHLVHGLSAAQARVDLVHLTDVDHVLKVDPSGAASGYTEPLPFSPDLQAALAQFVHGSLDAQGTR